MISEYKNIYDLLINKFSFLGKFGFLPPEVSERFLDLVGKKVYLFYKSLSKEVNINISYCRSSLLENNFFSIIFENKKGKYFTLSNFLKKKKIIFSCHTKDFLLIPEEEFISQFCRDFEKLCDNELNDIITGKKWEDIPFDWMGYK